MVPDDWEEVWTLRQVNLRIGFPWFFACEITGDWTRLRIQVEGVWSCLPSAVKSCGPGGHPGLALAADRLTLINAAPGCIIGKFGGSLDDHGVAGAPFTIGTLCYCAMPEKKNAQLFIGINGAVPSAENTLRRITFIISGMSDA